MDCREAQRLIGPFIEDKLDEDTLSEFLNHIKNCPDCHDELEVEFTVTSVIHILDDRDVSTNLMEALDRKIAEKETWLKKRKHKRILMKSISGFLIFFAFSFILVYFMANDKAAVPQQNYVLIEKREECYGFGYGNTITQTFQIVSESKFKKYADSVKRIHGWDIMDINKKNYSWKDEGKHE